MADFFRGILVTSHFSLSEKLNVEEIMKIYDDFYINNKLIKIQREPPLIKDVINTNYAIIGGYSISDDGHWALPKYISSAQFLQFSLGPLIF